ncbi:MAG TPA: sugar phosphate isomerase/epimerase family protein [Trueperaceae bacterium]
MRYLLCNEVVRELSFEAQCELALQLGFDGLELAPFTLGEEPHLVPSAERARLRRTLEETGCVVGSLHWLLVSPQGLSITSPDPAVRRRTFEVMEGLVELCADLGGNVLVHGSPGQRELTEGDRQGAKERAREAFARAGDSARVAGVTYCIEPLSVQETEFVNTVAEAAEIVEEIGNRALRTMIDCRAARLSESEGVADLIRRWVPPGIVSHVHLNDRNRGAPGQGEDEFASVLRALDEVNYEGYCGVEPFVYLPDGPTTAARAIGYLRGVEEGLGSSARS